MPIVAMPRDRAIPKIPMFMVSQARKYRMHMVPHGPTLFQSFTVWHYAFDFRL